MPSKSMSGMRACGSNPPGRPSSYFIVSADTSPCAGADPADAAHALLAAEQLLLDREPLLAGLVVDDQPRRPVAVLRVHVFVPQIERLEDVAVGVDHVVGAGHWRFLPMTSARNGLALEGAFVIVAQPVLRAARIPRRRSMRAWLHYHGGDRRLCGSARQVARRSTRRPGERQPPWRNSANGLR